VTWNYETSIAAGEVGTEAHVPGYSFYRDTRDQVTARCDHCQLGFVVRKPFALRHRMIEHMQGVHGGR
jgi:hypothetical protein